MPVFFPIQPDNFGMVDGLQTADCGVRCAEKTKSGGVHNCILTKLLRIVGNNVL